MEVVIATRKGRKPRKSGQEATRRWGDRLRWREEGDARPRGTGDKVGGQDRQ